MGKRTKSISVKTATIQKALLATLDPARQAFVPAGIDAMAQDANGIADVREFTPGHYRIHYTCATPSLFACQQRLLPWVDGTWLDRKWKDREIGRPEFARAAGGLRADTRSRASRTG